MKKSQSGSILLTIGIITALILVGSGTYLVTQKNRTILKNIDQQDQNIISNSTENSISTTNERTTNNSLVQNNLKTYINDKYKFSVQYPNEITPKPSMDCESDYECTVWFLWNDNSTGQTRGSILSILIYSGHRDLKDEMKNMGYGVGGTAPALTAITVNGEDGYKVEIRSSDPSNHNQFYFFKKLDNVYQISYSDSTDIKVDKEKILQSFRFVQ